jgi:hypothetical protein
MKSIQNKYPLFVANQVLTSDQLNNSFNYLEQYGRLTRTHLIGIGIVCGLEVEVEIPADKSDKTRKIKISKGCGVTSEGYLLVEQQENLVLSHIKDYTLLPVSSSETKAEYQTFIKDKENQNQYDLWELLPSADSPEKQSVITKLTADFLTDKVVLLFLELKNENLRNCSPNNCNDKGSEVTVTLRPLLIEKTAMDSINIEANQLEGGVTYGKLEASLIARLKLPDLRLSRFDIPNTDFLNSSQVLLAFHAALKNNNLVGETQKALIQTYTAFEPILRKTYPNNPFEDGATPSKISTFTTQFSFLNDLSEKATDKQLTFLQYYYDFFDDFLRAYYELRWKGVELMCACCPPEGLFPRHLMLSELPSASPSDLNVFRHRFVSTSATSDCKDRIKEVVQLFQRMVEMISQFTNDPLLIEMEYAGTPAIRDKQIHITPSQYGDISLSDKSIPYYYTKDYPPKLFEYWSAEKNRRQRSKQNLSYHAKGYAIDDFVINPLHYDLENYNFLRIEGHLDKKYTDVVDTLLSLKTRYRLPIEVIALSTGDLDEKERDRLISHNECHFQDLKTLCEVMRAELRCLIQNVIANLYSKNPDIQVELPDVALEKTPLIARFIPNFKLQANTLGALIETKYSTQPLDKFSNVDQQTIINDATNTVGQLMAFSEVLEKSVCENNWDDFEQRYQKLKDWNDEITHPDRLPEEGHGNLFRNELISQLGSVIYSCKRAVFEAINAEYKRRVEEIVKKQTLAGFIKDHPGIQHKAGVPLGGTFIVVYHFDSETENNESLKDKEKKTALLQELKKLENSNVLLAEIIETIDRQFPSSNIKNALKDISRDAVADNNIVKNLANGIVIADFYLPYLCCSDCSPVQFVLPKIPPTVTVQIGCTDVNNKATVKVTPKGGVAPYFYKIDDENCFEELPDAELALASGQHVLLIGDSAGAESLPHCFTVPAPLIINADENDKNIYIDDKKTYQVKLNISGGTSPYAISNSIDKKEVKGVDNKYTYISPAVNSGESITVTVTDAAPSKCIASKSFTHTVCSLPCHGDAIRSDYLFWVPAPSATRNLTGYEATIDKFEFVNFDSQTISLDNTGLSINANVADLNKHFKKVVGNWISAINKAIIKAVGSKNIDKDIDWFKLEYRSNDNMPDALVIEYFACHIFEIQITTTFSYGELNEIRTVVYTQAGTQISIGNDRLPELKPFNFATGNKCSQSLTWTPRCTTWDMNLDMGIDRQGDIVTLTANPIGPAPTQYLWEVEDALPSLLIVNDSKVKINLSSPEPKNVRLTAFSENGCVVTIQGTIPGNG